MGRRRRKVIRVVRRTLPKVYSCPRCGMITMKVFVKGTEARVVCGSCELNYSYALGVRKEPIDVYNEFVDKYMAGEIVV